MTSEKDLELARRCLDHRSKRLRGCTREVMWRHQDVDKARTEPGSIWYKAIRHWADGRQDLQLYLSAFKAQRELVRGLEIRMMKGAT